ncbi:MAG: MerR family transcriptional regulator [Gemmatimonadaceae bacterium]
MDQSSPSTSFSAGQPIHGIAIVERRTGVSQHLLRAWERRYSAVTPVRDEAGQRLYSDADIERIRLIRDALAGGRRIGQVASLGTPELRSLTQSDFLERASPSAVDDIPAPKIEPDDGPFSVPIASPPGESAGKAASAEIGRHFDECIGTLSDLDPTAVHAALMRAAVSLGPRRFVNGIALPLLHHVGDAWQAGNLRPVHEHAMSGAMRRVLEWLRETLPAPPDAPLIALATTQEQRHEFGAMIAAVIAAARQWRVLYLGCDLPSLEIAHAAKLADADVVAISMISPIPRATLRRDVMLLRDALPASTPLVVGGSAASTHNSLLPEVSAVFLRDMYEWDSWLSDAATQYAEANS